MPLLAAYCCTVLSRGTFSTVKNNDAEWHKSSYSTNDGACVEVATSKGVRQVRQSKDPSGPVLDFTADEWTAFIAGVKNNEFD
jgi:predicted secreted Zn-dependent protease